MEKRTRSPNYPAVSLPEALNKVTAVYRELHTHSAPREVLAKAMGYHSLNGASATAISALHKYGLLDRAGDEIKISDRAMCILHPQSPEERAQAIRDAASEPQLFAELAERFPGRMPNEELLRNYLLRNGFAQTAVPHVILAYRETSEFVARESGAYASGDVTVEETPPMHTRAMAREPVLTPVYPPKSAGNERVLGRYDFMDGGSVRLISEGPVDTEEALEMAKQFIANMERELRKRKERETQSAENSNAESANSDTEDDFSA